MSIQPASGPVAPGHLVDDSLEFVRFCYRRRRVTWPSLYDEMCAVAARGAFHGLGYAELAERGITFCLADLPALVVIVERVIAEERVTQEPSANQPPMTLSMVPARA